MLTPIITIAQGIKGIPTITRVKAKVQLNERISSLIEDKEGYVWAGTPSGLYRYDGLQFLKYDRFGAIPNVITMEEDTLRNLWVGTSNGLYKIPQQRDTLYAYLNTAPEKAEDVDYKLMSIQLTPNNDLWTITHSGKLYRMRDNKIKKIQVDESIKEQFQNLTKLIIDNNSLWVSANRSHIFQLDTAGHLLNDYAFNSDYGDFFLGKGYILLEDDGKITKVDKISREYNVLSQVAYNPENVSFMRLFDGKNSLTWIAHSGRLSYIKDHKFHDITNYFPEEFKTPNRVISLYTDKSGRVWLGTLSGLYLLTSNVENLKSLPKPSDLVTDNPFSIRGILEISHKKLIISSYKGLFSYNRESQTYKSYEIESDGKEKPLLVAYALLPYKNGLLIASEGDGLMYLDLEKREYSRYVPKEYYEANKGSYFNKSQWLFAIKQVGDRVYFGGIAGLFYIKNGEKKVKLFEDANTDFMQSQVMAMDNVADSALWVGGNAGLFYVDVKHRVSERVMLPIKNLSIRSLLWDGHNLWIGTLNQGVLKYDYSNKKVTKFTTINGLVDNRVNCIVAGIDKALWISTNNGISRLDTVENSFNNYFINAWGEKNEYNHSAVYQEQDGTLFFGGVNGVVYFNPLSINKENKPFKVLTNEVVKYNELTNNSLITNFSLGSSPHIVITPEDKYFSIQFSSLEEASEKVNFSYRVKEISKEWQFLGDQHQVQFPGLGPGEYTIELKGQNKYGHWSSIEKVSLVVLQVWYKKWWALLLFSSAGFITAYFIVWLFFKNKNDKKQLLLEKMHVAKLEELDQAKTRIFTNLAHEFRTPITLIQGPAESLYDGKQSASKIRSAGSLIIKQSKILLGMINQLLDISSLDAGSESVKIKPTNLDAFVDDVLQQWQTAYKDKGVILKIEYERYPDRFIGIDTQKLEKLIRNLLSNALKFTSAGDEVIWSLFLQNETNSLHIAVRDTGVGISDEVKLLIFDRFYQADSSATRKAEGSGIGLSLVKEYIDLMSGKIEVESQLDVGTTFHLWIPFIEMNGESVHIDSRPVEIEQLVNTEEQSKILVIEDNAEVRDFIASSLEDQFEVFTAADGASGKAKAHEIIPDVIVTDWMMPKIDGLTLTKQLKSGLLTGHIPIIMVTAKSTDSDRLESRSGGADGYLSKPFSAVELRQMLTNLITLRNKIAANRNDKGSKGVASEKDRFLKKLDDYLLASIERSDITVEDFLHHLGVSRTQLHRKMKSTTGKSINQYMREYKLQYARELIKQNPSMTVAEISYATGFNSPSYFSSRYKEFFGENLKH